MNPTEMFHAGYTDLISVIPPKATLAPSSKIAADQLGKVPGIRYANGTWGGYDWRHHKATEQEVAAWEQAGANFGLRAGSFPGLDIDSLDPEIVALAHSFAYKYLGPAPVRIGRAPKCLRMYRTNAPFTRMRMWIEKGGETHLIEFLGEGQQYLVSGVHPGTMAPYSWNQTIPAAADLEVVTIQEAETFFKRLAEHADTRGWKTRREGDGRRQERTRIEKQDSLKAPSQDALRDALNHIPNDDGFPDREDYIKMGAAIKAAAEDDEEGFALFQDWASRWTGGTNPPETVRADWRRLYPPFAVGWGWIYDTARVHGYQPDADEFPIDGIRDDRVREGHESPLPQVQPSGLTQFSDTWLAAKVVAEIGDRIRYVPATTRWLVWNGARWEPDAMLRAQAEIGGVLCGTAKEIRDRNPKMPKDLERQLLRLESTSTLMSVMTLVKADKAIAVQPDSLDADPWLLNTPTGVVDLRTGLVTAPQANQLHTKTAKVGPQPGLMPAWSRFLDEATGHDIELMAYMQRLGGYCLTGQISEQMFAFLWGDGGTGKSTFVHTLREIMGDYASVAGMETFTSAAYDRHTTELADLMGARLVVASETQEGRKWDEQRIKQLTGGDPVKARFMRMDNFVYSPAFKLWFVGNHQPHVRTLDDAMKRRIHMIGFFTKPAKVDGMLREKLRAEYPQILQWFINGCIEWQKNGLAAPEAVFKVTEQYFSDQDMMGSWLQECTEAGEGADLQDLFSSWREWCGTQGVRAVGDGRVLSSGLRARGFEKALHPKTRRAFFKGLSVRAVEFAWETTNGK